MTESVYRRLLVTLTLLLAPVVDSRAEQAPPGLDEATRQRAERLLTRPASPATEVLLIEAAQDVRIPARWAASLTHADPAVRGAAARAIRVALRRELRPAVEQALATEPDPLAASELADALIELAGHPHAAALEAARRHPQLLPSTIILTLLRVSPLTVPTLAHDLWPAPGDDDDIGEALATLASAQPDVASRVAMGTLEKSAPIAWAVWRRAFAPGARVPTDALWMALGGRDDMRDGALVDVVLTRIEMPSAPIDARLTAAVEAARGRVTSREGEIALELLERMDGPPDRPRRALDAMLTRDSLPASLRPLRGSRTPWLSDSERAVLNKDTDPDSPPPLEPRIVSIADLPAGVLAGVLEGADCPVRRVGVAAGTVEYNERGRPVTIFVPDTIGQTCRHRVTTLLRLGVATGRGVRNVLVHLSPPEGFATRGRLPTARMRHADLGAGEVFTTLRRSVKPAYTRPAIAAKSEGKVHIAVVVDERGRVRELELMRVLHPDLNLEALLAMTRWQFTPASRQGTPRALRILVEMEFSLR